MIGIDTNILVRFIVKDDENQTKIAQDLLRKYVFKTESIYINDITLCELIWVLKSGYGYEKIKILTLFKKICEAKELKFANRNLILKAVEIFEKNSADFADCLVFASNENAGCIDTYSFDRKANFFSQI